MTHLEKMLQPDSPYVFYDDQYGFCINTDDVLMLFQPERKRGRWIRITHGAIPEKYMCPFCHRTVEHEGVEYFVSMIYPFCHCGADMRGEEDAKRTIS